MLSAIIGSLIIVIFLIIVPFILGVPWTRTDIVAGRLSSLAYSYVMGFFVVLALFEVFFFPAAMLHISFRLVAIIYSAALLCLLVGALIYIRKTRPLKDTFSGDFPKWKKVEVIYLVVFICFLLFQLFYAVFFSRTYMADDGYAAFSATAIADNYINSTNPTNGLYLARDAAWLNRIIQEYNYFPAYLSFISGINPAIVAHTFIYAFVDILAYSVYVVISGQVTKKREDRFLFLIFVSIVYMWGYHSPYSITFRLLGPNSEGKAILSVVLAPFVLSLMYHVIEVGYQSRIGVQILVLSIAACCLSLGGVYTMVAILFSMVLVTVIRRKSVKALLYLIWGGIVPTIFAALYIYYRFR